MLLQGCEDRWFGYAVRWVGPESYVTAEVERQVFGYHVVCAGGWWGGGWCAEGVENVA